MRTNTCLFFVQRSCRGNLVLCESMEYKLIAKNSDMTPACERARSSFHRPTLNSPAAAPLRVRINQHLYFFMCQGPGILMADILFSGVLFWELQRFGHKELFSVLFRNHPMLTVIALPECVDWKTTISSDISQPSLTGS